MPLVLMACPSRHRAPVSDATMKCFVKPRTAYQRTEYESDYDEKLIGPTAGRGQQPQIPALLA